MENDSQSEMSLVQRAASGDAEAFSLLVEKHRLKIYRLIYFMVHHEQDTWDLLQDTFIKAYASLSGLKKPEIFASWLTKIAVNLAINHIQRKKRWNRCFERLAADTVPKYSEPPEQVLEQKECGAKLQELIAELPPKQRSVLVLCDIQGYSYKEIAGILHCRVGTVMSRLFYARNFLRSRMHDVGNTKIAAEFFLSSEEGYF